MPITQERFLTVLNAAAQLAEAQKNITLTLRESAQAISRANSVREHSDEITSSTIGELIGTLATVEEIIRELNVTHVELIGTLIAERKHFTPKKVRDNQMAQMKQARKRLANEQYQNAPTFDPYRLQREMQTEKPTWTPDFAGAAREIAEEEQRKRKPLAVPPAPETSAEPLAEPLVSTVPSLEELNRIGTVTSDENVL